MTHNELVTEACCQLWHTDPSARVQAGQKLAELRDRSAIVYLEQAWEREVDDETKCKLGVALSKLKLDRS